MPLVMELAFFFFSRTFSVPFIASRFLNKERGGDVFLLPFYFFFRINTAMARAMSIAIAAPTMVRV